jgi:group I intron endonuclease
MSELHPNEYCVYMHINQNNGKKYVGITNSIKRRWHNNGIQYRGCAYFWNAIKKHGWDAFEHRVIASGVSRDEAIEQEIALITLHQTTNSKFGYNLTSGGDGMNDYTHSEEARRKIGLSKIGNKYGAGHTLSATVRKKLSDIHKGHRNPMYQKEFSAEHREKISKALTGIARSDETRRNMSRAQQGHPVSQETIDKRAQTMMEKYNALTVGQRTTPVLCVSTGEVFKSIAAASERTGLSRGNICMCCKGQRKQTGGLIWSYVPEPPKAGDAVA